MNCLRLIAIPASLVKFIWIINFCLCFWVYSQSNSLSMGTWLMIFIQSAFCIGIIGVYLILEQIWFTKYIKNLKYKIIFMLLPITFMFIAMKKKLIVNDITSFSKKGLFILVSMMFIAIFVQVILSIISKFKDLHDTMVANDCILTIAIIPISFAIGFQLFKYRLIKKNKPFEIRPLI